MSYASTTAALIANTAGAKTTWESEYADYTEIQQQKSLALVMAIDSNTLTASQRATNIDVYDVVGATIAAAVTPIWTASAAAIITRVVLDITTVSTAASTIDIGYTATSSTTSADSLLDGVDGNAATGVFDSMNYALDSGANAKAQKAASGKWITMDDKTGDATGMVGKVYIYYHYL